MTPLIGRSAERTRLVTAGRTPPGLVMLAGDAGLGKSRLLAEVTGEVAVDRVVVTGRCHRLRDPFPLGPWAEVLRQLGDRLAGRPLPALAGALRPLVPEIADVLPPLPPRADDRLVQRHHQVRALVAVLDAVGPAVVVIEDAHWADPQTIEFLEYLTADPLPWLTLVISYRPSEADAAIPARAARGGDRLAVDRITLAPWDTAATGEFAAAALGTSEVTADFAALLRRRAAGNPLAVRELLALLVERGSLVRYDGEWLRRTIDELDVPAGVRDPVLERVSRLDDTARAVIEAAAILQRPVDGDLLATVSTLPAGDAADALTQAQRSGLLVERDGRYEVLHALAAQAISESLVTVRRQEWHARAAAALRDLPDPPLGQVAHHLRAAGATREWVEVAEIAAEQGRLAGDDEAVVDLLAPVLRETELAPDQCTRIALTVAKSAQYSLRVTTMVELLDTVLARVPPVPRAELQVILANLVGNSGGPVVRQLELRAAAAATEGISPLVRFSALIGVHVIEAQTRDRRESRVSLQEATRVLPAADPARQHVMLWAQLVRAYLHLGDPLPGDLYRASADLPVRRLELFAELLIAVAGAYTGDTLMAGRAVDLCHRIGDPDLSPPVMIEISRAYLDLVAFLRADWSGLLQRPAYQPAVRHPVAFLTNRVVRAALSLTTDGPTDAVSATLHEVSQGTCDVDSLEDLSVVLGPCARAAMARGEPTVVPGIERFLAAVDAGVVTPVLYRPLPAVTEVLAAAGDVVEAERLVATFAAQAGDLVAPLAPAAVRQAQGHLAAAQGRRAEAAIAFSEAADLHDAVAMPYDAAQAREAAANVLLASGPTDAEAPLRQAIDTYAELGASWDLDRATALARRHGIAVPGRHRAGRKGYGNELSPRERSVAELAAAGHTNREIADKLYLSVNTVNKHLRTVLHKLDLTSRRELRARW
ncbi:MAG TPA: AAA family ATPase [Micromonospora sp.]